MSDSVRVDDKNYIGVNEEYRNAAYDTSVPKASGDSERKELETRARQKEEDCTFTGDEMSSRGYRFSDLKHPSGESESDDDGDDDNGDPDDENGDPGDDPENEGIQGGSPLGSI